MQSSYRQMVDLTIEQALEILRSVGSRIGRVALCVGLQQGVYPFGEYIAPDGKLLKQAYYRISKARLMRWIEDEMYDEPVDPGLLAFMEKYGDEFNTKEE